MNTVKLKLLINKLKSRKNEAYEFFENIDCDIRHETTRQEGLNRLKSCFPISQYADFNFEEEQLLSEILNDINSDNKKI